MYNTIQKSSGETGSHPDDLSNESEHISTIWNTIETI